MRAQLSSDLNALLPRLQKWVKRLEEPDSSWYGSVWIQDRATQSATLNKKQTRLNETHTRGLVLRIYDGVTLFEEATDLLTEESIASHSARLIHKVEKAASLRTHRPVVRPFSPRAWQERLHPAPDPLDPEILEQVPRDVRADTHVHFGVRLEVDPNQYPQETLIADMNLCLDQLKHHALASGLDESEIDFFSVQNDHTREETLFADRESLMSQTLHRTSRKFTLMSGSDAISNRVGGLGGLECTEFSPAQFMDLARRLAGLKKAERLPVGHYTVVLGPAMTGVLAHEAFGHSQEGDTCARGRSQAWNLFLSGESVGNEHATILNNPAIYRNGEHSFGAWGSYFFDEEGQFAQEHTLLDRGVLMRPMTNLTSALRLDVPRTANGKRESWKKGIYTRQTNTYFSSGDLTYSQMLARVKHGFLVLDCSGGMEDPKGMGIQLGASYVEEIKDGKLTGKFYRGPSGGNFQITGHTPSILDSIVAKTKIDASDSGKDTSLHPLQDVSGCGKYHKEAVEAGCGGTYLLIERVLLA